jgi:hypothetical protein
MREAIVAVPTRAVDLSSFNEVSPRQMKRDEQTGGTFLD